MDRRLLSSFALPVAPLPFRRNCRAATLVTVNFQAPGFYARHGWEEFGRIESAPGVERIFMRKTLIA